MEDVVVTTGWVPGEGITVPVDSVSVAGVVGSPVEPEHATATPSRPAKKARLTADLSITTTSSRNVSVLGSGTFR